MSVETLKDVGMGDDIVFPCKKELNGLTRHWNCKSCEFFGEYVDIAEPKYGAEKAAEFPLLERYRFLCNAPTPLKGMEIN